MSVSIGEAVGYLDLDITGFLTKLQLAQAEAQKQTSGMAKSTADKMTSIGNSMMSAGKALSVGVTLPLVAIGTVGLKVATDFEKSMSGVKAISNATGSEFTQLRDKAIELGAKTAYSATEVSGAMTEMAKAGWNSQQILDGMGGVLDAAAASGEELGTVATIVADAITGFGLAASDSTMVADLLTQAANSGTIGINDLGETFKYIAPIASAMGLSIEDVTTAVTAMSTAGIKGSQAGTALRGTLTRMTKPTDDVAAAMSELGIEITNSDGSFKSLDDIVKTMRTSFNGLTDEQKAQYAATIAGQEGMSGLLALLNMSQEEYDALSASMENADGVAKRTAETMQDNLASKFEQLKGSLESLAIRLGDIVIPKLTEFVEKLTEIVDKFTNLPQGTQKAILSFLMFAAILGPILLTVGKLITAIPMLISGFSAIGSAIGGVTLFFTNFVEAMALSKAGFGMMAAEASPAFGVISTAIAAITPMMVIVASVVGVLVAAFATLWTTSEQFRNSIGVTFSMMQTSFNEFTQGVVDRINALGFEFQTITDVLWAAWQGLCSLLAPIFIGVFNNIAIVLETIFGVILGIMDVFIGLFTGNWEQMWNGWGEIVNSVGTGLIAFVQNIFIMLGGVLDAFLGLFGTSWSELWTNVSTTFMNAWNGITAFFTGIGTNFMIGLQLIITNVQTFFSQLPTTIATFFNQVIINVQTWATNMAMQAQIMGSNFINNVKTFFAQLPYNVGFFIANTLVSVALWVVNMVNKAREMGTNFINAVRSFFTQLPGMIQGFITTALNNVVTWANNMRNKAQETGTNFINSIRSFFTQLPGLIQGFISSALNNVVSWVSQMISNAQQMGSQFVSNVSSTLSSLPGIVMGFLQAVISQAVSWVSQMATKGFEAISQLIDGAVSAASAIPGTMASIGSSIVDGVWSGFSSAAGAFADYVYSFFSGLVDGAKAALNINSPSKRFRDEVGAPMAEGTEVGFVRRFKSTLKTIVMTLKEAVTVTIANANKSFIGQLSTITNEAMTAMIMYNTKKSAETWIQQNDNFLAAVKKTRTVSLAEELAYWQNNLSLAQEGTDDYFEVLNRIVDVKNQIQEKINSINDTYYDAVKQVNDDLKEEINDIMKAYDEAVTSRAKSLVDSMSLFKEFTSSTENTKQTLLSSLQSQVDGLRNYEATITSLMGKAIPTDLLNSLKEMGVDASADLQLLNEMTEEELSQYVALWQEKNSVALRTAIQEVDKQQYYDQVDKLIVDAQQKLHKLDTEYKQSLIQLGYDVHITSVDIGTNMIKGIAKGVDSAFPIFVSEMQARMIAAVEAIRNTLDINSPSGVLRDDVGYWLPLGIRDGFIASMPDATKGITDSLTTALGNVSDNAPDIQIGVAISDSFKMVGDAINSVYKNLFVFASNLETKISDTLLGIIDEIKLFNSQLSQFSLSLSGTDSFGTLAGVGNITLKADKNGSFEKGVNEDGDTYIFYSPKAIDEIEAAKQIKRTKRDIKEGF